MPGVKIEPLAELPFNSSDDSNMTTGKANGELGEGDDGSDGMESPANSTGAASDALATASLDELQSKDYRQVLKIVDRLRLCGLGSILRLPQLVVCGNQSSGKSSVLKAITKVPFPRNENLCTRFATELVMRRDPLESISTKIIPDKTRSEAEQVKLPSFKESITNFGQLLDLIDRATELIGLVKLGDNDDPTRAFSRDVLSVERAGPERPQLTLVEKAVARLDLGLSQTISGLDPTMRRRGSIRRRTTISISTWAGIC